MSRVRITCFTVALLLSLCGDCKATDNSSGGSFSWKFENSAQEKAAERARVFLGVELSALRPGGNIPSARAMGPPDFYMFVTQDLTEMVWVRTGDLRITNYLRLKARADEQPKPLSASEAEKVSHRFAERLLPDLTKRHTRLTRQTNPPGDEMSFEWQEMSQDNQIKLPGHVTVVVNRTKGYVMRANAWPDSIRTLPKPKVSLDAAAQIALGLFPKSLYQIENSELDVLGESVSDAVYLDYLLKMWSNDHHLCSLMVEVDAQRGEVVDVLFAKDGYPPPFNSIVCSQMISLYSNMAICRYPFIRQGTSLLINSKIFHFLGVEITRAKGVASLKLSTSDHKAQINIGSRECLRDGKSVVLTSAPVQVKENLYLPAELLQFFRASTAQVKGTEYQRLFIDKIPPHSAK